MVMQKDPYSILLEVGVFLKGHFVFSSGRHSNVYVNKDALLAHTAQASNLCRRIASFADPDTEVVAAPAIAGAILSQWVAYHLSSLLEKEVLAVYAEPGPDNTMIFKRGYDQFIPQKRVFVVEDVLTSGRTARDVVDAVRTLHGKVVGVGALLNRGNVTTKDLGGVPWLHPLVDLPTDSWVATQCPQCKEGVPINTEVGRGAELLLASRVP